MNKIAALLKLADLADLHGDFEIADRFTKLAQHRDYMRATGDEMEAIRKDLKKLFSKAGGRGVSPETVRDLLRSKYHISVSDERLRMIISDEQARLRMGRDPLVNKIGKYGLEGWEVQDIGELLEDRLSHDEIYDKWKQFVRENPGVRRDLLRRPDIVYARPSGNVNKQLRDTIKETGAPEGADSTEVLRHEIGEASGDPKIQMRSDPDFDEAAIETYRLSLLPEFQRPDGSPDIRKLIKVVGGTKKIIDRRLYRANRIVNNIDTRIFRRPEDREAARDLVSQLAGQGYGQQQLMEALNDTRIGDEPEWTDNNLFGLFGYQGPNQRKTVVPVKRWPDYRAYLDEENAKNSTQEKF